MTMRYTKISIAAALIAIALHTKSEAQCKITGTFPCNQEYNPWVGTICSYYINYPGPCSSISEAELNNVSHSQVYSQTDYDGYSGEGDGPLTTCFQEWNCTTDPNRNFVDPYYGTIPYCMKNGTGILREYGTHANGPTCTLP